MTKYFSQGEGFHFKLINPPKEGNVAKHTNSSQLKHFLPEYFFPPNLVIMQQEEKKVFLKFMSLL